MIHLQVWHTCMMAFVLISYYIAIYCTILTRCHDDNDGDVSVELNKIRLRGGDFEVVTTKSSALRCVDKNSSNR